MCIGQEAGSELVAGNSNVYIGLFSGSLASTGSSIQNVAVGRQSLQNCTTNYNTAVGGLSGRNLISGTDNAFLGHNSGTSMTTNGWCTVLGSDSNCTDGINFGIALGFEAKALVNNQMVIGSPNLGNTITEIIPAIDNTTNLGSATKQFKDLHLSGTVSLSDGTLAAPSLTFTDDLTTGLSRDTGNDGIALSVSGSERLSFGGLTIPAQMSSNILPSPQVASSSSSLNPSLDAWRAFDRDPIQYWHSATGVDNDYNSTTGVYEGINLINIEGTDQKGEWLKLDMGVIKTMSSYRILPRQSAQAVSRAPNEFYIAYSDDGVLWSQADYNIGATFTSEIWNDYTLSTPVRGRYFVIVVLVVGNNSETSDRGNVNIAELEYSFESDAVITANAVLPRGDASCDLGSSTNQFKNLYVGGQTLSQTIRNFSHVIAGGFPVLSGLYSTIADQTIAATTVETSIFNGAGALGTLTIPGGAFQVGSIFDTHLSGYMKTKTTGGGDSVLFKLKFGASIISQTAPITINIGTNSYWACDVKYVIRSIGATATLQCTGTFTVDDGVITSFGNFIRTTDYVFDSTIANTYNITCQWGTNDAANIIVCQVASNTTKFSS